MLHLDLVSGCFDDRFDDRLYIGVALFIITAYVFSLTLESTTYIYDCMTMYTMRNSMRSGVQHLACDTFFLLDAYTKIAM